MIRTTYTGIQEGMLRHEYNVGGRYTLYRISAYERGSGCILDSNET
jgi:hypothetical protein